MIIIDRIVKVIKGAKASDPNEIKRKEKEPIIIIKIGCIIVFIAILVLFVEWKTLFLSKL